MRLQLKDLHDRAACESVDDGSRCRLDHNGRLADLSAGQPLNLLSQLVTRHREQRPMVLLDLRRPTFASGENPLSGRQCLVEGQHNRVLARNHGHGLRRMSCSLQLHRQSDLGKLLGKIRRFDFVAHERGPLSRL